MQADCPISAREAAALFADLADAPVLVLAVSGGPDSTALMVLAARWRARRKRGPKLIAVTVDHGLRPESAKEAAGVARVARALGVTHRTLRWRGAKPATGLPQAARAARYRLLGAAARKAGARHVLTAHTLDDQAETVLFRLARGSGVTGLKGMTRVSPVPELGRTPSSLGGGGVLLVRPLLEVPKSRLVATCRSAKVPFAEDPSNRDPRFTRPRLRALMAQLAAEGLDAWRLAAFARRMARADAALDEAVTEAEVRLTAVGVGANGAIVLDAQGYAALPREVALRLAGRAIARVGEGPVELAKLEALIEAVAAINSIKPVSDARFRRTLAGAMVTLRPGSPGCLVIERAPPRRAFTKPR